MAIDKAIRRGKLFDLFVGQPGHDDVTQGRYFFCPLCRRPFEREATAGENPQLTLAHIIPDCLDGTWTTLCCRDCNSGNGHEIETDFLASHALGDWVNGRGSIDVRMGDGGRVKAEMTRDPVANRIDIKITTPMVNPAVPAHRDMLQGLVNNPGAGEGFNITLPWFRTGWCKAAVCQSAYLLMFKYFGYDFARSPTYGFIREQIFRPDDEHEGVVILDLNKEIADQFLEGKQAAVIFVREPIRAILAVMRFRSPGKIEKVLAVVMPGPDEPLPATVDLNGAVFIDIPDDPEYMSTQEGSLWLSWHQWIRG